MAEERKGAVTMRGNPMTLVGPEIKVGQKAPNFNVVGKAMQLHGGIGYTWESGIHVYLKRAALNRSLFGSPAAHRRQLAQRYL